MYPIVSAHIPEGYPEPRGRLVFSLLSATRARSLISLSLVTLATILAALTMGNKASAFGQTVNLQEVPFGYNINQDQDGAWHKCRMQICSQIISTHSVIQKSKSFGGLCIWGIDTDEISLPRNDALM